MRMESWRNGINGADVRRLNRLSVLRHLAQNKGISRVELAEKTGLTKMTISNIVAEFEEQGLIMSADTQERDGAGRKPVALQFSPASPAVAGLWVSRDYLSGIVTDMHLSNLAMHTVPLAAETADSFWDKLYGLIDALLGRTDRTVCGIGIASIGPVDVRGGQLLNPPNFHGLNNLPLVEQLTSHCGRPVYLQNDMNAGALAELYFGLCRGEDSFVYIGAGNGVGAGMVADGRLFSGSGGFAGEIGHMVLDAHGPLCHCGNRGCLETYVSIPPILEAFRQAFDQPFEDFTQVCAFSAKDARGRALLDERLHWLATGLVGLCNTTDPRVLVLGEDLVYLLDDCVAALEQEINRRILARGYTGVRLMKTSFGTLSSVLGAAVIVLEKLFDGVIALP